MFRILIALFIVTRSSAATVTITVGGSGNNFSPAMFTINPGDTIKWVWSSGFHNTSSVTLPAGAADWYSNITDTDTSFSYTPSISGLYTYTCTYHSGMNGQFFVTGCTYPDKPIITSTTGTIACQGDTLQLSVPLQTGVSYQWINGSTSIPLAVSNTLDVTLSGNYKVLVNRCGMDSISDPFAVIINPKPEAGYTYSNTGLSFTFLNTNTSPGPYTFIWTLGDGSPDQTTRDVYHTFPSAGNYFVTLKVTDTVTGCSDTFSNTIEAAPVGIIDPDPEFFSVFPNPVITFVQVSTSTHASIFLSDLNGNRIKAPTIKNGGRYSIDVGMLRRGIYILKVITARGSRVQKISIAH